MAIKTTTVIENPAAVRLDSLEQSVRAFFEKHDVKPGARGICVAQQLTPYRALFVGWDGYEYRYETPTRTGLTRDEAMLVLMEPRS